MHTISIMEVMHWPIQLNHIYDIYDVVQRNLHLKYENVYSNMELFAQLPLALVCYA